MFERSTVRIFISSPADVRPERLVALRVIERLAREFAYHLDVKAILWEREPLVATHHFQDPRNIPRPANTDIVVVILWSRLGLSLPEDDFRGAISGRAVTGTEWEFEDALAAARAHGGVPDLLVYRKNAPVTASLDDDEKLEALRAQKKLLEDFITRWFGTAAANDVRAASHGFVTMQQFEDAVYAHLAALLERRVGGLAQQVAIRWHDAPFRGLESFDLEHAAIFFGRTQARNELRELLARQVALGRPTLLLVSGASGSGKSSLVKAGVLPDLRLPGMIEGIAHCRYAIVRPAGHDGNPLRALAEALTSPAALPELPGLRCDANRLEDLLRVAPMQASLPIEQALALAAESSGAVAGAEARLILVVDQFEEIFTDADIGDARRTEFAAAIDALAQTRLVWVILTLRSDFVSRLGEFPTLSHVVNSSSHYVLFPPTDSELGQIVRQPAREAGLRFEVRTADNASLDETIRRAASQDPNVLPLLSFLLDELWRTRTQHGELQFAAYERLGGLEGALARRADEVFLKQPAAVQDALPRLLRALVTVEAGGRFTARTASLAEFPPGGPERRLIEAFTARDARLLVTGGENGAATVRVAHEALLTHWDLAARCLATDRDDLELTSRLRHASARWRAAAPSARNSLLLAAGLPLEEARDFAARRAGEVDADLLAYVTASSRADQSRRRTRFRIVAAAFGVLVALSIFAVVQWRRAAVERAAALVSQSQFLARDAESAVDRGDAATGVLLALEALPKNVFRPDRPVVQDAEIALSDAQANQRERRDFAGHARQVNAATFSPDGMRIASGSDDGTVRTWDVSTGRTIAVADAHAGSVYSVAFSPDGRRVLSASYDGMLRLWDASSGAPLRTLAGHHGPIESAAFSPDGRLIASGADDHDVRLWDDRSGGTIAILRGHARQVNSVAFSPDGRSIVSGSDDGYVYVWNRFTHHVLRRLGDHEVYVRSVAFSGDGRRIVSAYGDGTVRVWDAASGLAVAVMRGHEGPAWSAAFSPDGRRVVSASADKTLRLWDVASGSQINVFGGHAGGVTSVAFSRDGRAVISASADRTVRTWDPTNGALLAVFGGHQAAVYWAQFSPDGRLIATASEDQTVRIWDAGAGKPPAVLRADAGWVRAVAFSPDGRRLAAAYQDKAVRVWDVRRNILVHELRGHALSVWTVAFSPDGRLIAGGSSDKTARVWNATTGSLVAELRGHDGGINSVAFSPDSRRLATASNDKTVRVWDLSGTAPVAIYRGHEYSVHSAVFSPDGRTVVSASEDKTVRLWDTASATELKTLRGHDALVYSAAFSPDGKRVVSASTDNTVRFWDVGTGLCLSILRGHQSFVFSAQFSPDGRRIVTASGDKTVRVWDATVPPTLGTQALIDAAIADVPRRLTAEQRASEFINRVP
jgi:WD40 repeat protein